MRVSRDTQVLLGLAGAKLLFHLLTHRGFGVFRDELYYLACAARPALGYVDHPPLSIWLLWGQTALFGDSLLALRLLPGLAGAASVLVAGLLAREMGGGRGAQVLTALAVFGAPQLLAVSHFYSMNVFDWLMWSLLAWVAARVLAGGNERGWLLFGVLAGLTLLNKLQVAAWALGLVIGLLLSSHREHLTRRWIWLGGACAALLFLPHLVWQVQWGWPTLEFIANASQSKNHPTTPLEFLEGQILLVGPLALPLWLLGLLALFLSPARSRFRPLGWAYLVAAAIFVGQQAKVYYLTPAYPVLLAAGAVALEGFARERALRFLLPTATAAIAVATVVMAPMAVPVLPAPMMIEAMRAAGIEEPRTERQELAELPQVFADMHGWNELVEALARARDALPEAERDRVTILTHNYGEAGAVDRLGAVRGLPQAISGHNSYWLWGPRGYTGGTVLSVGFESAHLAELFEEVTPVGGFACRYCMPREKNAQIHVLRRPRLPLDELWERLRRFI